MKVDVYVVTSNPFFIIFLKLTHLCCFCKSKRRDIRSRSRFTLLEREKALLMSVVNNGGSGLVMIKHRSSLASVPISHHDRHPAATDEAMAGRDTSHE